MKNHSHNQYKLGLTCAISTYLIWGVLPLYWDLLHTVDAFSILAQRVIWTLFLMILLILSFQRKQFINDCTYLWKNKKKLAFLVLAAALISINWFIYIWAVNHNHVVDTSIGYYLNPLFSVLLGVILFKEYIIWAKRFSMVLAALGIIILTFLLGIFPWIAIGLTLSFGLYGAVKKQLKLNPFSSITLETLFIFPISIYYLIAVDTSSWIYFDGNHNHIMWYLIGTGITTAVPMILFSFGANHLPLNLLGFLQYISPSIALILAIFYFHEAFTIAHFIAFSCIWAALVVFSISEYISSIKTK